MMKAVKGYCLLLAVSVIFYFFVFDSPQSASRSINLVDILDMEMASTMDTREDVERRKNIINKIANLLKKGHIDITENIYNVLKNDENFRLTETEIDAKIPGMFAYKMEFTNKNMKKCSIIFHGVNRSIKNANDANVLFVEYEGQNGNNAPTAINIAHYVYGVQADICRDIAKLYPRFPN